MNQPPFNAPSLETITGLLPAFEFKALIASNEFSAVYLASQRSLDRDVAVKILAPHTSENSGFRQSFETTARMMAKLNHPNLISVFDSGFIEGMLYFVMEFVPGKSLERSSKGHCVETSQAVLLIEGISEGLAHAHDHGIFHGGLTTADILLNQKAEPKIGNFGFTHPSDAAARTAPDQRTDIHAVGAILYELITARPHRPDAAPPSSLSKCDAALDAVWRQATHPDPAQRFPGMRAFLKSLKEAVKHPRAPITATIPASQKLTPRSASPESQKPAVQAAPPITAPNPVAPVRSVGMNWKLLRNLVIIAGLLYAISYAWDFRKKTIAEREKHNREILAQAAADKEKALADARKRSLERASRPLVPDPGTQSTPTRPDTAPQAESTEESLARLRSALASGDRTEMPTGTTRQGDFDYVLVREPMSWPEAFWFAEQHGGHLAIPSATADLTWLVGKVAGGEGVWIGAARSGRTEWTLVDGLSWAPKKEPTGIGSYLAVDRHGFLRAEGPKRKLPFIIQWHQDGSNPGKLATLLEKTNKSLAKSTPVFPPGTQILENRRFLFVNRPLTWRDAVDLAEKSGGHLAVTSEVGETAALLEMTREQSAAKGIWLGGFLRGDRWLWITGEPWKTAKWASGATTDTTDSALIIQPGKGWSARKQSELASGFVIEWSNDRKSSPATSSSGTASSPAANADTSALVARAKELIAAADRKRTEQLGANSRRFISELDIYLRNLPKSERQLRETHVTLLKASVKNNRLPTSIPESSGIRLSQEMAKTAKGCAEKQDRIDADFLAEVEKIRPAFVAKIQQSLADAKQSGQTVLANSLEDTLATARKPGIWVSSLGFELQPENPIPAARARERTNTGGNFRIPGNGGSLID